MYAGIAKLQTGAYEEAIAHLKKYDGEDPILLGRAQACIGDAYVELENYRKAIAGYEKAAKTTETTPSPPPTSSRPASPPRLTVRHRKHSPSTRPSRPSGATLPRPWKLTSTSPASKARSNYGKSI